MIVLLRIYKCLLNVIYFFLKFIPTKKNRILFLSRQNDNESIDFNYIIKDIKKRYPNSQIIVLSKRMVKIELSIKIIVSYVFHSFKQLYYLATSKVCVIDGYQITVSCLKHKKDLKVVQIWHSLGAIKKFGYQNLNTKYDKTMAKVMCMHKNYNVIVSGSIEMTKYFKEAFNYPEDKFISSGLPRIDFLLETKKKNKEFVYKIYPKLKKKKVVLYAPTFRVYNEYKTKELIKVFKNSKYELIVKPHPRMHEDIPKKYLYPKVSSLELLSVADLVITDYSAISIEAAILDRPLMLYVYDYDKYVKEEGINTNLYEDLPGYVFENAQDLYNKFDKEKYDKEILKKYKEKYVTNIDGTSTRKLVDCIMRGSYEEEN